MEIGYSIFLLKNYITNTGFGKRKTIKKFGKCSFKIKVTATLYVVIARRNDKAISFALTTKKP